MVSKVGSSYWVWNRTLLESPTLKRMLSSEKPYGEVIVHQPTSPSQWSKKLNDPCDPSPAVSDPESWLKAINVVHSTAASDTSHPSPTVSYRIVYCCNISKII